ncbi:MAG TPA: protein kinase [Candidatus Acidoferrales bacterium]|nr:protein kinase [Candidatus Acidoferrales bacterium]
MPLPAGTKLGPYEIVAPLGAGGMGEVYRARDTRLGRDVAVKVLPASFAKDAERLRRFEQEARAAGALNHPNILAIYDIGVQDGAPYLVTELLEGETLRERLRASALPVRKALDLALQAIRGVAAAHDRGIIHRDLKPANIFLTNDGHVKILDFGLAKLIQPEAGSGLGETQSPTRTADPVSQTGAGVVLGTVGYMSPEQVRGNPADARSDIFALGTIIYEMLSGQRAFEKDSSADTMAAILKEEPPELSGEGKKIPPAVERVVRHCLEKNPAERFQSARDLGFDLESLTGISSTSARALTSEKGPRQPRSRLFSLAVCAAALLAAGLAGYFLGRGAAVAVPTYHQLTFDRGLIYSARFAVDGPSVYYSAAWSGQPVQIYSTNPSSPESRALNFPQSALFDVSSSEMAISIGCKDLFIGDCEGALARVPISGGAPRQVAENVVSADWTADGSEMAAIRDVEGKFRVEFPLGNLIYESPAWLDFLRVSPDGKLAAFAEFKHVDGDVGQVVVVDRTGKQIGRSAMFTSVEGVAWPPSGNEVWFASTSGNEAWANSIQALSLAGKGRILLRLPSVVRLHDVSRDGRLLLSSEIWATGMQFRGPGDAKERDLSWLDGAVVTDISPDGANLAFEEAGESVGANEFEVDMRGTDGSSPVKLGRANDPVLSPDGKWMLGGSVPFSKFLIFSTGAGQTKQLAAAGIQQIASLGWMPDGTQIYFVGNDGQLWRVYIQDLVGGAPRAVTPSVLPNVGTIESDLVSPDGKYIFARDLIGKGLFYPLAGGGPTAVPGMTLDDIWANWSSDGKSAYVYQNMKVYDLVFRLDLATGQRQQIMQVAPQDTAGVNGLVPLRITPDGKAYAYTYNRALSTLFIADGVK